MWIFLWILASAFILGVFGWSSVILWQQKQAWAAFARKHKMEYKTLRFLDSATVRGTIGGFRMSLFSDARQTNDMRRERYFSVIEFELGSGLPTGAAIGTGGMKEFIDNLSFPEMVTPEHEKWTGDYIARTRSKTLLKEYLTPLRLDALLSMFGMKNASVLYFFDEIDAILHIETVDPLRDAEKLNRIVNRILAAVKVLAPHAEAAHEKDSEPQKPVPPPQISE